MNADDLQQVRAGFHDQSLGSQSVFRTALDALSHPGRLQAMPSVSEVPRQGHGAAAMLLQALVDSDCSVWLSPLLAHSDAAAWLRFHTGCRWATSADTAGFVWIAQGDAMPGLATLDAGSDAYPDQSATLVLEVAQLSSAADEGELHLEGPGIQGEHALAVNGLPEDFTVQWAANHQRFPRGVDVFLASPNQIAGLPRTTRIRAAQEA